MVQIIKSDNTRRDSLKNDVREFSETAENDLGSLTNEQFLHLVGSRVRHYRMKNGMSRKLLAKGSGVSERYLAQLESGQGNISISLLRNVAMAIDVKLETLMSEQDLEAEEEATV